MQEIWKAVAGYEGLYEVSDMGRVRSLDRTVQFVRGGKTIKRKIHSRLRNGWDITNAFSVKQCHGNRKLKLFERGDKNDQLGL